MILFEGIGITQRIAGSVTILSKTRRSTGVVVSHQPRSQGTVNHAGIEANEPAEEQCCGFQFFIFISCTFETNSTCKLTVLRVEPHVIPAHKRMRIIPFYFLPELHNVRFLFVVTKLIPTITWLMMPKFHYIIYSPCSVLSFPA
jgi:hypothetical protein